MQVSSWICAPTAKTCTKSAMHMQNCCFAKLTYWVFCRSRCHPESWWADGLDGQTNWMDKGTDGWTNGRTEPTDQLDGLDWWTDRADGRREQVDRVDVQMDRDGLDGQKEGWVNEWEDWTDGRSGHWADGRVCFMFLLNKFLDRFHKIWVISFTLWLLFETTN